MHPPRDENHHPFNKLITLVSEGGSLIKPMPKIITPKENHATMPGLEYLPENTENRSIS